MKTDDPLQEDKIRYVDRLYGLVKQHVEAGAADEIIGAKVVQFLVDCEQKDPQVSPYLWKMVLEDRSSRQRSLTAAVWSHIRRQGGVLSTSIGILVGKYDIMLRVLSEQEKFSVEGDGQSDSYWSRMRHSIGAIYLGRDIGSDPAKQSNCEDAAVANTINDAISGISRSKAFTASRRHTAAVIKTLEKADEQSYQLPLSWVVDQVLALICQDWFDIPDGKHIKIGGQPIFAGDQSMHCPYHYAMPSRFFFSPAPNDYERQTGMIAGRFLQRQTKAFFKEAVEDRQRPLQGAISKRIFQTLKADPDKMASTLVGVMMGFLPTVNGNMLELFQHWLDASDPLKPSAFWVMQNQYAEKFAADERNNQQAKPKDRDKAQFLEPFLTAALQHNPIPEMIWRVAQHSMPSDGSGLNCPVAAGQKVILGIMSALQDVNQGVSDPSQKQLYPVFGGKRAGEQGPVHACPGYEAAMGVMLGMLAAVLEAGTASHGRGVRTLQATHLPLVLQLGPVISSAPSVQSGSPP